MPNPRATKRHLDNAALDGLSVNDFNATQIDVTTLNATTGNITTANITTENATTSNITTANITSGAVTSLTSDNGIILTLETTAFSIGGVAVNATANEINAASDPDAQIVTLSTTPIAITAVDHHNKTCYITKTDGIAITLPAPAAGMRFRFIVGATIAAASTIKSVDGTHIMIGGAILSNDSDNTIVRWPAVAASTYDTIDLFGTANSTGGMAGQIIEITALSSTLWHVDIRGDAAGNEATPFADTVA